MVIHEQRNPNNRRQQKAQTALKNKTMVTLHNDYSPLKCMQSVILRAVDVVDVVYFAFSVCYELFFAKSTYIYYENQLYKFIREQFIAKFPYREPPMKSSISRLIQKLEIWGRALNASYCCAPFGLTRAFSNLVRHIDYRLINEGGWGHFEFLM